MPDRLAAAANGANSLAAIPGRCPYMSVDPEQAAAWRRRVNLAPEMLNVGLAWAGSAVNKNDRNRSATLADFAPLAAVANVRFLNLQLGPPAQQLADPPPGL